MAQYTDPEIIAIIGDMEDRFGSDLTKEMKEWIKFYLRSYAQSVVDRAKPKMDTLFLAGLSTSTAWKICQFEYSKNAYRIIGVGDRRKQPRTDSKKAKKAAFELKTEFEESEEAQPKKTKKK